VARRHAEPHSTRTERALCSAFGRAFGKGFGLRPVPEADAAVDEAVALDGHEPRILHGLELRPELEE
jgi:hypothetical protein